MQQCSWEEEKPTSNFKGEVVGAYRSTTLPSLSTRNLVKFHLIPSPRKPPFCDFKYLNNGPASLPFTLIWKTVNDILSMHACISNKYIVCTEHQGSPNTPSDSKWDTFGPMHRSQYVKGEMPDGNIFGIRIC
jgi:hypothetical protein